LAVLLFLAAGAQLIYRLILRPAAVPLWDFASVYSSTRAWLAGENPYDADVVKSEWIESSPWPVDQEAIAGWSPVYPPTTLVLMSPLAVLPVSVALIVWAGISVALAGLAGSALVALSGFSWRDSRTWLLISGIVASTPFQFGLRCGQPTLVALSCVVIGIWCIHHSRCVCGGVTLALACAIKPHVALPFLIYYMFRRERRVTDVALLVLAATWAVSLTAMQLSGVDWIHGWMLNIREITGEGGINDPSIGGPYRDEIVSLHVVLHSLSMDDQIVRVLAGCAAAVLVAWYVRVHPRERSDADSTVASARKADLLPLAALAALSMLPVYHRVYDALILAIPLAWALAELDGPQRRLALVAILPLAVFLIPLNFLNSLVIRLPALAEQSSQWWWHALVVPHYAWGSLLLTLTLMWSLSRQRKLAG
jgi:hypothetical protein